MTTRSQTRSTSPIRCELSSTATPRDLQRQHDVAHVDAAERIQRAGRLVEDHELGPGHQGDRQPEALLHALREAADPIAGALGQAHERQAVALLLRGHVDPRQADVEGQHLGRAQPRLVPEELRQVADAGARGRVGRGPPEEHHLARVGADQAEEHLDHRGLAGAVRTEQPDHLAAAHLQGHVLDRLPPAVPLAQARAPDGGRRRQAGDQVRRRADGGVVPTAVGSAATVSAGSRATDRTSSASSEPATTVTTPSSTHTTAAIVRSRVASTVAGTPFDLRRRRGDLVGGHGQRQRGAVRGERAQLRRDVVGQAGQRQQVVAHRLERDAGGEGRRGDGATDDEGGHAGGWTTRPAATPGPATSRTWLPSRPGGGGGSVSPASAAASAARSAEKVKVALTLPPTW